MQAGTGVTVSGTGQVGNPYVIDANVNPVTVTDTQTVDLTLTGQDIMADVNIDPLAGNLISVTPGGLRVDCGDVSTCFAAGQGINPADLAAGVITACLSADAGNILTYGTDDCIYVSAPAMAGITTADTNTVNLSPGFAPLTADVIIDPAGGNILTQSATGLLADIQNGCGLSGQGTLASPLAVNTSGAWPFACPEETNGGKVYCSPGNKALYVDPEKFYIDIYTEKEVVGPLAEADFPPNEDLGIVMPSIGDPEDVIGTVKNTVITNPSLCRSMQIRFEIGTAHLNTRWQGDGRINALFGARLNTAGALVPNVVSVPGQSHQQWLYETADPTWDVIYDTTNSRYIAGTFTLPPGGAVTVGLQATGKLQNGVSSGPQTVLEWTIFFHATGWSL